MAGQRGTAADVEQAEPVVQPVGDLGGSECAQPGGGQLDGERRTVQRPADPHHGLDRVRVEREPGAYGRGPVGEQAYRLELLGALGVRVLGRQRERRHGAQRLTGDADRLAAGGQDPDPGRGGQEPVGQPRDRVDQVLAVVQHEDEPLGRQGVDEPVQRLGDLPGLQEADRLGDADRDQHGLGHVERTAYARQGDEPHAVGRRGGQPARGLAGEPGLAGAAGAGERDEPGRGEQLADAVDLLLAADEAGELRGEVGPGFVPRTLRLTRLASLASQDGQVDRGQVR